MRVQRELSRHEIPPIFVGLAQGPDELRKVASDVVLLTRIRLQIVEFGLIDEPPLALHDAAPVPFDGSCEALCVDNDRPVP
mmetsp:Transcript_6165/g.8885  ORF Transcript_6165/g.8885 Transcript_6165/m.8885 type:complete len:81 (-) Transcript_6165:179-421(-)